MAAWRTKQRWLAIENPQFYIKLFINFILLTFSKFMKFSQCKSTQISSEPIHFERVKFKTFQLENIINLSSHAGEVRSSIAKRGKCLALNYPFKKCFQKYWWWLLLLKRTLSWNALRSLSFSSNISVSSSRKPWHIPHISVGKTKYARTRKHLMPRNCYLQLIG